MNSHIENFLRRAGYGQHPLFIEPRFLPSGNRYFVLRNIVDIRNSRVKSENVCVVIYVFHEAYPEIPREEIDRLILASRSNGVLSAVPIILKICANYCIDESNVCNIIEENCLTGLKTDITESYRLVNGRLDLNFNIMCDDFNYKDCLYKINCTSIVNKNEENVNFFKKWITELNSRISELEKLNKFG